MAEGKNLLLEILTSIDLHTCTRTNLHAYTKQLNITNYLYGISQSVGGLVTETKVYS